MVSGELYGGDAGTLGASIRARLSMDGAISSPESMGEAASVLERLGQQMLYVLGVYGDDRPEDAPKPALYVHSLALPDQEQAESCMAEISPLLPARARIVESRQFDPDYLVEIEAAFPELPPDPEYFQRQDQLDEMARRHGGRWASRGAPWW